ncbi:hypothetical protein QUA08_23895 [Microcoleus sp. T3B2]|uniref:hypothetical protein n=1 Tax=Microcoleus sp. T3B2 TaxID=3055426 RepID=UPI002FD3F90B
MPVPQENSFFVERASCPFLTMVQDVSLTGTYPVNNLTSRQIMWQSTVGVRA